MYRSPKTGDVVGRDRFQLRALLGSGSTGMVFEAYDRDESAVVAVKVLTEMAVNDAVAFQRFVREACLMRRLRHPNVVRLLSHAFEHGETPYIVMECLRGETLASRVARCGAMEKDEAIAVFSQVLAGVVHCQSRGIVHRDLNMRNVFLANTNRGPARAILLDFGVAKSWNETQMSVTLAGDAIGTLSFMAPEQMRGVAPEPSIDVYAIGVALALALTGRGPFPRSDALENYLAKRECRIRPECLELLPPELRPFVKRCLAVAPEDRYRSAEIAKRAFDAIVGIEATWGPGLVSVKPLDEDVYATNDEVTTRREVA